MQQAAFCARRGTSDRAAVSGTASVGDRGIQSRGTDTESASVGAIAPGIEFSGGVGSPLGMSSRAFRGARLLKNDSVFAEHTRVQKTQRGATPERCRAAGL